MARIVITRPNGETEYAELTTDKTQAGNDRLAVEKAGTVYYAKLDREISTHMYVIQPNGRKMYVQKEAVAFTWKYTFDDNYYDWDYASKMVIPRTGKYKLIYQDNYSTKESVFNKGDKFIKESKYSWYLINRENERAYNTYTEDWNSDPDIPEGESVDYNLKSIEYIGEA